MIMKKERKSNIKVVGGSNVNDVDVKSLTILTLKNLQVTEK